ncbi:hypothetical protein [Methanolobus sp. ZRKC5]|uniref:hypothetical protein n=1 Tax=unclassified Methanolobus TaxID=2629569 RepID=UPI00313BEF28
MECVENTVFDEGDVKFEAMSNYIMLHLGNVLFMETKITFKGVVGIPHIES